MPLEITQHLWQVRLILGRHQFEMDVVGHETIGVNRESVAGASLLQLGKHTTDQFRVLKYGPSAARADGHEIPSMANVGRSFEPVALPPEILQGVSLYRSGGFIPPL